jgi:hypothetical protein
MSVLDFLNLDQFDSPGDVQQPAELAAPTQQPVNQAANPAVLIEMAAALKKQETETKKTGNLPVMYDGEGRKLGPTGLLLALQRDLRLARQAGNGDEIKRLELLIQEAEAGVEAFVKKSGLSRAELFPDPVRSVRVDQADALAQIVALKARCEELHVQAANAGKSVTRFKRLLEARDLQGQAALVALSAGLIDRGQLDQAGQLGVWNLIDLTATPCAANTPGDARADVAQTNAPQERNRP